MSESRPRTKYEQQKDLTQVEFVHRALTTTSGQLKHWATVKSYLRWMEVAKVGGLIEKVHDPDWMRESTGRLDWTYGSPTAERMLLLPKEFAL